jgi:quercetin dioxygenase-like cupin family protein
MDDIKQIGTIQLLESIYNVEPIAGSEGSVAPLLYGEAMSCHLVNMPPGTYAPHPHRFELSIMCVKGECELIQGELRHPMKTDSIFIVPKNEESGFEVKGPGVCSILVFVAPKQWTREEFYAHARKNARQEKA